MTYCGFDCCANCPDRVECGGCEVCKGHPFGGSCVAERNADFADLKRRLIEEINGLEFKFEGLHVEDLNLLRGSYVNLSYLLQNGTSVRLLKNNDIYLGNQIEKPNSDRCYGVIANERFLLVSEYGCNGSDPEVLYYSILD